MGQGKAGWWIAGAAVVVVLVSVGYGLGHKKNVEPTAALQTLTPAGAPLTSIQIEPIQPQQELAAITSSPTPSTTAQSGALDMPPMDASSLAAQAQATAKTALPTEESARIREIQKALKAAGFDPGTIDGRLGARTRTAVRDFQRANGLEPDGKVGPRTWAKLETYLSGTSASSSAAPATTTAKSTSVND